LIISRPSLNRGNAFAFGVTIGFRCI
jgi:hypothetical protein